MKNNKKGFTLIELLAVIVILAIIALIATPIVLNIIDDTKKESELRSADFYLDALELSISQATLDGQNLEDKTYNIMPNGNICLKTYTKNGDKAECKDENGKTDNTELVVEVKGEVPTSGTITITSGQISDMSLIYDHKEVTKNSKGELVYVKTLDEVCEYKDGTKGEISSKYECKVDPNKDPYTFYILSYLDKDGKIVTDKTNAKSVNLIMDSNIATGGIAVKDSNLEDKGAVAWINQDDYLSVGGTEEDWNNGLKNNKGPITAMNYLEEATKTWTNTNEIKINIFSDEKGSEKLTANIYNIKARIPYKSEVSDFATNKNNEYLYEYLDSTNWKHDETTKSKNKVSGVGGYWNLSFYSVLSTHAWKVSGIGISNVEAVAYELGIGVRPVITLKV